MKKPNFLFLICLFLMLDMTSFSFLAPILPDLIVKRGINLSIVGLIFSFYPVSYFFVSLYLGKSLSAFDKRGLLIKCQMLLVLANILFGMLDFLDSNILLIILSIFSRLVQGTAIGGACSILYAYVPELYPREQEETFAIIEMSVGAGVSIGPVLGGLIYSYLSYEGSFYIIAAVYAICSFLFLFLMKNEKYNSYDMELTSPCSPLSPKSPLSSSLMDNDSSKNLFALELDQIVEPMEFSYKVIFRNRNFFLTFFCYVASYTSITLIQPTFSDHLHSYGYDSDTVGLLFALSDLAYALTSIALIKIFKYFKRKHLFVFGGALTAFSLLLLGPEHYTFLPKDIIVICVGMVFFGLSQVFYNATIIPEFIDLLIDIYGHKKGINEMGSGVYNAGLALAEFLGPLMGGILADSFGFGRGLTIYAGFLTFYLLIYGFFIKRPERKEMVESQAELNGFVLES